MDTLSLCNTPSPTFLVLDYEVVAAEDGTCVVTFTERDGTAATSPAFPNKKLACEWAGDHLHYCGF